MKEEIVIFALLHMFIFSFPTRQIGTRFCHVQITTEYERLKNFMRARIDKYVDQFRDKLTALWDKCLLSQRERDEFVEMLHDKADTMEQARVMIQEHLDYLSTLQTVGEKVFNLMRERRDLIQKMIDFEKTASDPRRLFQSSFQLLQEEKWRKACYPNLLKLEDALVRTVIAYENNSKKPFVYQKQRYLDALHLEITERNVNQTFFGFLDDGPKRPPRKSLFEAPAGAAPGAATFSTATPKGSAQPKPSRNSSTKSTKSLAPPVPNGASTSTRAHSPIISTGRGTRTPMRSQLLTHANLNSNAPQASITRRPRTSSFSSSNSTSIPSSTPSPSTSTHHMPPGRRTSMVPAVADNASASVRTRKISLPASVPATRPASPAMNKRPPPLPISTTAATGRAGTTRANRAASVGSATPTTRKMATSPLASPPQSGNTESESTETKGITKEPSSRASHIPAPSRASHTPTPSRASHTPPPARSSRTPPPRISTAKNTGSDRHTNDNGSTAFSVPTPPSPTKKLSLQDLLDPSVPSVAVAGPVPTLPSLKGPRGRRMSVQRKTSVVKEVVRQVKEGGDKVIGVEQVVRAVDGAIKGVDNVTKQAELVSTGVAAAMAMASGHKRKSKMPFPMVKA
ncbi:hypothetical protein BC936DRAFT_140973 [Jimgerdemannia flammicorona]|uniref:Microtubule associated protein-domain-containing protein n=1 Tax=Jimgerdemannia flammicorona TaxID=994334 RepID=A0A433A338_9FUNG|nr:hypothetical protein BC936DRAFT_140973 [Jimgerdemannia flammicorona]